MCERKASSKIVQVRLLALPQATQMVNLALGDVGSKRNLWVRDMQGEDHAVRTLAPSWVMAKFWMAVVLGAGHIRHRKVIRLVQSTAGAH